MVSGGVFLPPLSVWKCPVGMPWQELGVYGFQQGSAGWPWHCCPLVPRWLLPGEPWCTFIGTRASSASSVSLCPAKNSLNLTCLEARKAGFPCTLLPSLLSIGGLCCKHSRRCCWSCKQVSNLEFWYPKPGGFGFSTQQPHLLCLSTGH